MAWTSSATSTACLPSDSGTRRGADWYWVLSLVQPSAVDHRRSADLRAELLELLTDVVRCHLISDVPLGVFLSGGLDSSTIVALMRRVHNGHIKTFSIGFHEPSYDELP